MPRCPGCNTLMTRTEEHTVRILTCSNCFGNWIAYPALLRLIRPVAAPAEAGAEDASAEPTLQELAAIVVESNTTKRLRCPECHVELRKDRMHPMVPVEIDRCPRCQYVWLDVGELPLLKRLYQELQSSTDPRVMQLREKIAGVAAQWEGRTRLADQVAGALDTSPDSISLFSMLNILTGP